jgi:hypothetical protein
MKNLKERLDIAKYKSDFEIELFFNLMHKTLSFSGDTADENSSLNRHVSCVGLRFRFLVMALSIVQSSHTLLPNTIAKWILRERIYHTALDTFTANVRAPTQTYAELREDIKYLLEFWNKIIAEKKYLKEENFLFSNNIVIGSTGSIVAPSGPTGGSGGTPDGNSITGIDGITPSANMNMALGSSVTYNSVSGIHPASSGIPNDGSTLITNPAGMNGGPTNGSQASWVH